jgi:hypothetical protein
VCGTAAAAIFFFYLKIRGAALRCCVGIFSKEKDKVKVLRQSVDTVKRIRTDLFSSS